MFNKSSHQPEDTPLHSSGLARVARGSTLGSTSSETFAERKRRDLERKHVGRYRDSHIVRRRLAPPINRIERVTKEDTPASAKDSIAKASITKRKMPISKPIPSAPRKGFAEPKARGYNPYS